MSLYQQHHIITPVPFLTLQNNMNVSSQESHAFLNRLVSRTKRSTFLCKRIIFQHRNNNTAYRAWCTKSAKVLTETLQATKACWIRIPWGHMPTIISAHTKHSVMPADTLFKPSVSPQVSRLLLWKETTCDTMRTYCKSIRNVQSGVKRSSEHHEHKCGGENITKPKKDGSTTGTRCYQHCIAAEKGKKM